MTECKCDEETPLVLDIAAGQDALPRQLRAFPEVREALLRAIPSQPALAGWDARGERDLGLMWLEMWAYVTDVLGFYDERIANESYLRTAQRRVSLRRLIELLGYIQTPGSAGTATLAALADGRKPVNLPVATGFRSDAFGSEPPQVFEVTEQAEIHPFNNQWELGPFKKGVLPQPTPTTAANPSLAGSAGSTRFLVFDPSDFGLAKDRIALVRAGSAQSVTRVSDFSPFEGADSKTYVEVEFATGVGIPNGINASAVQISTPTITAVLTRNNIVVSGKIDTNAPPIRRTSSGTEMYLDAIYRQLRAGDFFLFPSSASEFAVATIQAVSEELVAIPGTEVTLPVSKVGINGSLATGDLRSFAFHFAFVKAGTLTTVAATEVTQNDFREPESVPVTGIVEIPPGAVASGSDRVLTQRFLLEDADGQGALVKGSMRFNPAGRASFQITDMLGSTLTTFKLPVTVFGNVVDVTRGETVVNEVLGSGDPRTANQRFQLKKKPLTYLEAASQPRGVQSTLTIHVNGVAWHEVTSFFSCGPQDPVYIVRHTDSRETIITFGDGTRGARLPAGIDNVVANYRFGAGAAAPPEDAIRQISRAVPGLRSVSSPVEARAGRDPDDAGTLRTTAPQSLLVMDRAVSIPDFQALAAQFTGVIQAHAEFVWIDEEQRAGVLVTYVGSNVDDGLSTLLRLKSDPNLAIKVNRATALARTLKLSLAVDTRFDNNTVANLVKEELSDSTDGILAPRNADIGGQFWSSKLYAAVLSVNGTVAVQSADLVDAFGQVTPLIRTDVVCVPQASYFDFTGPNAIQINPVAPTGNVADLRRRVGGC
jgi:hypothetical protein